jgi:signal peptidase II
MDQAIEDSADPASLDRSGSAAGRVGPLLLVAAVVFVLDQLTKALIRNWLALGERWPDDFELLRLSHVENDGAAFGMLQGAGPLLVVTTVVAIALIMFTMLRSDTYPRSHLYALALILGGAIGNLSDRLARGSVTDFIEPTHYPSFNLADSAIVVGVAAIVVMTLFQRSENEPTEDEPAIESSQDTPR